MSATKHNTVLKSMNQGVIISLNPIQDIQDGEYGAYQFFPCNFYTRINIVLNLLPHWCTILKFVPSVNPILLNLNQDRPSKKADFLVKSS